MSNDGRKKSLAGMEFLVKHERIEHLFVFGKEVANSRDRGNDCQFWSSVRVSSLSLQFRSSVRVFSSGLQYRSCNVKRERGNTCSRSSSNCLL